MAIRCSRSRRAILYMENSLVNFYLQKIQINLSDGTELNFSTFKTYFEGILC